MAITFAVQGHPATGAEWVALARRAEALGFEAISTPDHPGTTAAPFVALAALAQATARLRLAPSVVNAGAWSPLALAAEVATLDRLSDGRAVLGIGAGHTPAEWTMVGRERPDANGRVDHLVALVDAVRRLLAGDRVSHAGEQFTLHDAALDWPSPPRPNIPLLVGGFNPRLVEFGARAADVVELTGLGRTLPDGHRHAATWSTALIERRVAEFRRAAAGRPVRLGALVQKVQLTDDRPGALAAFRQLMLDALPEATVPSLDELAATPFVLVGTEAELVRQLRAQEARWGITRYTVRADVMEDVAPLIEALRT